MIRVFFQSVKYSLWIVLWLWGCHPERLWEEMQSLEGGIWHSQQALSFHFLIRDAAQPCHIFLNTRYEARYPYHNMYVSYTLSDVEGQVLRTGLKEITLFDAHRGKPLGRGSSAFFFKEDTLLRRYLFQASGRYTVQLRQFMRVDSLLGVRDIGLRLDRAILAP